MRILLPAILIGLITYGLWAQSPIQKPGPSTQKSTEDSGEATAKVASKIAWYGKLADGLQEAKRSKRPILLVSAAPQCEGVPGIW